MRFIAIWSYSIVYSLILCLPPSATIDNTAKETLEEKKEEVKEMILEGEDIYLRDMTIMMDAGARYFCWSVEMEPDQIFNLNYKVLSSDSSSGRGHYVGFKLSGSQQQVYHHVVSDNDGKLEQWRPPQKDYYQLCFDGVYSAKSDKKVSFYMIIEGKPDPTWGQRLEILDQVEEVEDLHIDMKERIAEIRRQVNQAKRTQWMRRSHMSKDIMRMDALQAMIDKWSKIHIFVVVSIALAQVYIFRDMFSSGEKKLQRHRMGAQT